MEQKLLNYKTICCKKFSETENCRESIAHLKKCIRQHLSLDEAYCILISCLQDNNTTETIIMIECVQGAGMKIYKTDTSVKNIVAEDIPDILSKSSKQKLSDVCLATS